MGLGSHPQMWQELLSHLDVAYSYRFAKQLERYKTNDQLGYRTAGSYAEYLTGEMIHAEMCRIGLQEVRKDAFQLDGWEFCKARLTLASQNGHPLAFELGGYQTNFHTHGAQPFQLVYAGRGTARDFDRLQVAGKLVLIDINQRDDWWINYPAYQAHLRGAAAVIATQAEGYAEIDCTALNAQDICGPANAPAFSISKAHASLLKGMLAATGKPLDVCFDAESHIRPNVQSYNIVGSIPGRSPEGILLMTAHYDSYFAGFQDDNAAVAMMMGIAKALVETGHQPEHTLVFCALAAEEWGATNTRYDWSTGAYNQVFRVRPDWPGRVLADINFELPAHAHDTRDVIRCVYELQSYLTDFARTVPPAPNVYPDGVEVVSPVLTWSDDFSIAISGIPSMVNDFSSGNFMQSHYHSQFDSDEAYDEPSYQFHHVMYAGLMLQLDRCAVPPLDFSTRLCALQENLSDLPTSHQAETRALRQALLQACDHAKQAYQHATAYNRRFSNAVLSSNQTSAAALLADSCGLTKGLLAAFRLAEDGLVGLTWHDEPIFPHQHALNNLHCLQAACAALAQGDTAQAVAQLADVDNNWYALHFDQEVFRYFSDYVLHQPPERLFWGAGRVAGQEDLSDLLQALQNPISIPVQDRVAQRLQAAICRQETLLRRLLQDELYAVQAVSHTLADSYKPCAR